MTWILALLAGLLGGALVLGDGTSPDYPDPGADHALVATWSQSSPDLDDLDDLDVLTSVVGTGTLVVDTEVERDALLARVPDGLPVEGLAAVDLATHLVVAGGYSRCTESSSVEAGDHGWVFVVSDGDEGVACDWSPYTIDVWSVPRPS